MKTKKPKAKSKSKAGRKLRSSTPARSSQPPSPKAPTAESIMSRFAESSKESNPELIGEEIVKQFSKLLGLSAHEDVEHVIERIVNHMAEILQQTVKTTPELAPKTEVREQLVHSAQRFSDAAFALLPQISDDVSEIMAKSLVQLTAGQCDNLKKAVFDNPKPFQPNAERIVCWPSNRAIYKSYQDDFQKIKRLLNLGGKLPIKTKGKPNPRTPASREVLRFMRQTDARPKARTKDKQFLAWRKLLHLYLENNKCRLLLSPHFQNVRGRKKLKEHGDKEGYVWAEIKKDCDQSLKSLLP